MTGKAGITPAWDPGEFAPILGGTVALRGFASGAGGWSMGDTATADVTGTNASDSPGSFQFQWHRDNQAIPGATNASYAITLADAGGSLFCRVSHTVFSGSLDSNTIAAVLPALTGTVSITGTVSVGNTVTANVTGLNAFGADGDFQFQWFARGEPIPAFNPGQSHAITLADAGGLFFVRVTHTAFSGHVDSIALNLAAVELAGAVAISGNPDVGQVLAADTSNLGGSGAISFQWFRGATAITTAGGIVRNYTVTNADIGHMLWVRVTRANNTGYVDSNELGPVGTPLTGTVAISGTPMAWETLAADTGGLGGGGAVSHQWRRGAGNIPGATGPTLRLSTDDIGQNISVRVTRANNTGHVDSASVGPVVGRPLVTDAHITGTPRVGETLHLTQNNSNGEGRMGLQWRRGDAGIPGASNDTLDLTGADYGQMIGARISYELNPGFFDTDRIGPIEPNDLTGAVGISGTPMWGHTLTADTGGLGGGGPISFQWTVEGLGVAGGNSPTFTINETRFLARTVRVRVTRLGNTGFVESEPTSPVRPSPLSGTVAISGLPHVGEVLEVAGVNLNAPPLGTITFQWLRGASPITGAAGSTYTPVHADTGHTLSLRVGFTETPGHIDSNHIGPINPPRLPLTGTVTIAGLPHVGRTLTAHTGGLGGGGAIGFQWHNELGAIDGATGPTYTTGPDDEERGVFVRATRANNTGFVDSNHLFITYPPWLQGTVAIRGVPQVGRVITANTGGVGGWGDLGLEWRRGDAAIPGATGRTYTPVQADVGGMVSLRVRRSMSSGFLDSNRLGPVMPGPPVFSAKLYAVDRNQRRMVFESGVAKGLLSRRWEFEERF